MGYVLTFHYLIRIFYLFFSTCKTIGYDFTSCHKIRRINEKQGFKEVDKFKSKVNHTAKSE